jgi:hypothetical protein
VDDRRPISLTERIRSERWLGIAFAIGAGAAVAAFLELVAPTWALVGLVVIPVLIALRELIDLNRANRRAWHKAESALPASIDHGLVLRGIARPLDQRVVAPYSLRECLAYRGRFTGTQFGKPGVFSEVLYAGEQRERIADLIVVVGDAKILVEGDAARLACDPCAGDAAPLQATVGRELEVDVFLPMTRELAKRARHQEVLLLPGDEVVLVGYLVAERQRGATHRLVADATLVVKPAELATDAPPVDVAELAKLPKVRARPYRQTG